MYVQRLDKSDHRAKANKDVLRFWDSLWYSFSSWMQQVISQGRSHNFANAGGGGGGPIEQLYIEMWTHIF